MGNTVARSRGRWQEILPRLGIASKFLKKVHGPCPLCGGKDRFRFDDKDGTGSYFCNQCGPGRGLGMAMKANGWSFAQAARAVDEIIGRDPPPRRPMPEPATPSANHERMIAQATAPWIVKRYLTARGLSVFPEGLLGAQRIAYRTMAGEFAGYFQAMLAPVLGRDGDLRAVHRTYIGEVPEARKKLSGPMGTGAAIRLFEPGEVLGVAEGVETAIAAHELFGVPTWATISSSGMESFAPPEGVQRLVIFGDHDSKFGGQKSAYALAHRLHAQLEVEVQIPRHPGDWLDVLNERGSNVVSLARARR